MTTRTIGVVAGAWLLTGASAWAQDWPQWRGANRDNKVAGFIEPKTWPKELTKQWSVAVGQGDSSPVLVGDKLYVFGRVGAEEVLACLDAANGKELWKSGYKAQEVPTKPAGGIHAGPRSTPTVADGKVCSFGARGMLRCVDAAKGDVLWEKDTGKYPGFYTSSSPLIVDGLCIVCLGGDKAGEIAAFNLVDGSAKWSWTGGAAPYGSPVLMTAGGTRQVIAQMSGAGKGKGTPCTLVSVNLADGKKLWDFSFGSGYSDTMATPIVNGDELIYSAPTGGTIALKVAKKDDTFTATSLWKKKDAAHKYNTPVLRDGVLYGLSAKDSSLFCMNAETGERLWTDTTARGQCGHVLSAGPVLLSLSSDMYLIAFQPDKTGYRELGRYKVAETQPWAAPLIVGNRVYVKDQNKLTLWTIE
jgi:outer membrane protein assembly factor BamB